MIYTEGIHLISDTSRDELHEFAAGIGFRREWLHETPGRPHYDLVTEQAREKAIRAGARLVRRRELVAAIRRNPEYQAWMAAKEQNRRGG